VLLVDETAEKVDSTGRDSVGANSRRPYGPSDGFDDVVEGNLLRRTGPPDQASDFFSGLRRNRAFRPSRRAT
jgi:hypothetical protein